MNKVISVYTVFCPVKPGRGNIVGYTPDKEEAISFLNENPGHRMEETRTVDLDVTSTLPERSK